MATEGWGKAESMLKKEKTRAEDEIELGTKARSAELKVAPQTSTVPDVLSPETNVASSGGIRTSLIADHANVPRIEVQALSMPSSERLKKKEISPSPEGTQKNNLQQGNATRQVIAVSASKGPSAFFNLARKFLVTDEMCDLSALEGAIVSAVDAAHLLERSKLARIVRIQTSYVAVGPKRKKSAHGMSPPSSSINVTTDVPTTGDSKLPPTHVGKTKIPEQSTESDLSVTNREGSSTTEPPFAKALGQDVARLHASPGPRTTATAGQSHVRKPQHIRQSQSSGSGAHKELRRARIVITVKRTEEYKRWLDNNPHQDAITGSDDFTEATTSVAIPTKDPTIPG